MVFDFIESPQFARSMWINWGSVYQWRWGVAPLTKGRVSWLEVSSAKVWETGQKPRFSHMKNQYESLKSWAACLVLFLRCSRCFFVVFLVRGRGICFDPLKETWNLTITETWLILLVTYAIDFTDVFFPRILVVLVVWRQACSGDKLMFYKVSSSKSQRPTERGR